MAEEDPDEPQVAALRAVWLAMRDHDEDPPDSGLSALMAAARSQAVHMTAKPRWWQRGFEQVRRPPVLALATLLVLIGGAVLMTKHQDTIERAPTAAPARYEEMPATSREVDVDRGGGSGGGGGGAAGAATTPASPGTLPTEPSVARPVASPAPAPASSTAHEHRVSPRPRTAPEASAAGTTGTPRAGTLTGAGAPTAAGAPTRSGSTAAAVVPAPARAYPGFEPDAAEADTKSRAPVKRPTAEDEPAPRQVLLDQLAARARRAAQRGDCENAKAIATRIAGQDATYYRDHVANELANCVPAPASTP